MRFLGVDAGNSKTVALVADAQGRVRGQGSRGVGDIYGAAAPAAAVDEVLGAVTEALAGAGANAAELAGAAFRLAGVDWPEDEAFWRAQLAERLPELARVSILNDGFAPIRCGEPSGVGVAIVAGTGPAVAGRGPAGERWCISFWVQEALGAGGIGDEGLRAVFRAATGVGPPTVLTDRLLEFLGHSDVESLLHAATARGAPGVPRAPLAPQVTRAAADGDPVASEIVTRQAERLADYGRVVAARVGFDPESDPVPVILAGSVLLGPPPAVSDALVAALSRRLPKARPRVAALPPVAGAVLDALAEAGVPITPEVTGELARAA